jgi:putative hemolysin
MPTEILVILALILANGLFAGAEIAVISVGAAKLAAAAERQDKRALAVQKLREKPERFLATVQIGITVIGTAAAAFGGANIARSLAPVLERLGFGGRSDDIAFGVVIAGISFLSLVLGELVPKSLALRYSHGYAYLVGRPLLFLARLASPVVHFLTFCSNLVLRFFGDRTSFTEARVSRDELMVMVEEAGKTGSMDPSTSEIASRALELQDVAVAEIMVRRERIVAIPRHAPASEVRRLILEEGHSRMPVYEGDLDRLVGFVVARDVLAVAWEGDLIVLEDIIRPLMIVPATAKATTVLRQMQARRTQIAAVVDELGAVVGLVTMEDLVEEIVGEIRDEDDEEPEAELRREPDGSTLVPGWLPIRKVNRELHLGLPIDNDSTTIAGLCLALALSIPPAGTRLHAPDGTVLEIVDSSQRRVRMVRILPRLPAAERADERRPEDPAA